MSSPWQQTVLIDSNIWISHYLNNDAFHLTSQKKIGHYFSRNFQIILPVPVIYEIITVLGKYLPKDEVIKLINAINKSKNIQIVELNYDQIYLQLIKYLGKVRLRSLDYVIFAYCAKFRPDKFESNDIKFKKTANLHLYHEKN